MNELELTAFIHRAFGGGTGPGVVIGIGDDAAVLAPDSGAQVLTTDALHAGVHFELEWILPEEVGARAVEINLSDLAAMGAQPRALLLAIGTGPRPDIAWIERAVSGMAARARERSIPVVGGNVSRGQGLSLTATAVGRLPAGRAPLCRSGARPGDRLFCTGPLGGAALGLACLQQDRAGTTEAAPAVARWRSPRARTDLIDPLADIATAAIDISDGLAQDLGHLAAASGVATRIEAHRVPRLGEHAALCAALERNPTEILLAGGEDYELVFACPPEQTARANALGATEIGEVLAGGGVVFLAPDGSPVELARAGHRHF